MAEITKPKPNLPCVSSEAPQFPVELHKPMEYSLSMWQAKSGSVTIEGVMPAVMALVVLKALREFCPAD